jgi:dephospho-coA kinase
VARLLEERGIPVYDTDSRAKALYDTDGELREAMIALFGAPIYTPSGLLDRKALASLIFADRSLLEQVNALVHPAVRRDFVAWRKGLSAEGKRLCALESALLLDAGLDAYTDGVLAILADDTLRLQRAMMRDGASEEAVRARMQHQMPQEKLAQRADFLIYNDEAHPLTPQLDSLFDKLLD